jgi:EAL domain-containing protein (putative c-di-GMP-specific phosphodiesterase class I)
MHRASELGGGRYELFDEGIRTRTLAKLETESALRRAVEHNELRLYYQPEIELTSGSCRGVEALMRWQHPTQGLLEPIDFIPVAEEAGLIGSLGRWALREACRQAAAWVGTDVGALAVSVNLSAHQLTQPDLTAQVTEALDQSGLDPALLCLELTESALMRDVDETLSILKSLRDLGVSLSIDDFGTGYSSLLYLRRYPVSFIKIDRGFVAGLDHSSQDEAIVSGVIGLGHAFGLKVVAEGVETAIQATKLRFLGCELGQGYLWSPAIPPADMQTALASLPTPSSASDL